jgi:hypothetical protein
MLSIFDQIYDINFLFWLINYDINFQLKKNLSVLKEQQYTNILLIANIWLL